MNFSEPPIPRQSRSRTSFLSTARPSPPEHCDKLSCRECWLAWLATGEPPKEKGPSSKRTTPHSGASQGEQLLGNEPAPQRYRLNVVIEDDKLPELKRLLGLWIDRDIG